MYFFFWTSLPVERIITNLPHSQSDRSKKRVHCYFNFTKYNESECKIFGFNIGVIIKEKQASKESFQIVLLLQSKSTFLDTDS